MKSISLARRGLIAFALLFSSSALAVVGTVFVEAQNNHSPWRVGNGWGICGGYGTKYLKQIPTEIYPAIYDYLHIPHNRVGAIAAHDEVTAVDPKRESSDPHGCTSSLNNFDGTDSTFSGIVATPLTYKAERAKALTKARMHYSGVIPPGATKAIQILINEYVSWPSYSGHDPYVFNLQIDANYSLSRLHDLVLGYYPQIGWKVVFEYARSDAPYQGYPPTGS